MKEVTFSISCGEFRAGDDIQRKSVVLLVSLRKKEEKEDVCMIQTLHRARFIASDKSREPEVSILFNFMQLAFLEKD